MLAGSEEALAAIKGESRCLHRPVIAAVTCCSHLMPSLLLLRARLSLGNSFSSPNLFGNRQLCSLLFFSSFWISAAYTPVLFPCLSFGQRHQAFAVLNRHSPSLSHSLAPFALDLLPGCYRQSPTKYGRSRGIFSPGSCNEEHRGEKGLLHRQTFPLNQHFEFRREAHSFKPAQRHHGSETSHARAAGSPEGKMGRHYRKCLRTAQTAV